MLSSNSRKIDEKSMPEGKDGKPGLPIKKKARIVSEDGDKSHGEGNGESEDLQGPSQDGFSFNPTDNQGSIKAMENSNKAELSGSTIEKVKIAAPTCAPRTKSAFGSLGRRGSTPKSRICESQTAKEESLPRPKGSLSNSVKEEEYPESPT